MRTGPRGRELIQELIWAGWSRATRFSPSGDKVMRLHAQAATIENGFVFLPEAAPWLADYLAELLAFRLSASSSAKGGLGWAGLCGFAEAGFLVLPEVVHVEVAVGFEPVLVGFDS